MSGVEKCGFCGATSPVVQQGVCGGCMAFVTENDSSRKPLANVLREICDVCEGADPNAAKVTRVWRIAAHAIAMETRRAETGNTDSVAKP